MKTSVSVLGVSIRQSTFFGVFVFFLRQYAIIDSINVLPSGIIFNAITLLIALEQQAASELYLKTVQDCIFLQESRERVFFSNKSLVNESYKL
jgi:hypothetical protein